MGIKQVSAYEPEGLGSGQMMPVGEAIESCTHGASQIRLALFGDAPFSSTEKDGFPNLPGVNSVMRIAVIADTHGKFPTSATKPLLLADEIWHLGDFCDLATLNLVQALGRPFYAVLGNNDWSLDLPSRLTLERCGKTFHLIHIAPTRPTGGNFLLHGHTHVPRDEMIGTTRVLNPGSLGKANKGAPASWGWLEISDDGSVNWRLEFV